MSAVTITPEYARELACKELSMARSDFLRGRFDDFNQGQAFGALRILWIHMGLEDWIYEGIKNEMFFMMREADSKRLFK